MHKGVVFSRLSGVECCLDLESVSYFFKKKSLQHHESILRNMVFSNESLKSVKLHNFQGRVLRCVEDSVLVSVTLAVMKHNDQK